MRKDRFAMNVVFGLALLAGYVMAQRGMPAPSSNVQMKGYAYCYSEQDAGKDTYLSDVFPVELTGVAGHTGGSPDLVVLGRIQNAFYDFLAKKHYAFKRGVGVPDCDFRNSEQAVQLLKRQKLDGNPCSNCGKMVDTGWKYRR